MTNSVLRGQSCDALNRGVGRLERVGDLEIQFRHAGQVLDAADQFMKLFVVQAGFDLDDALDAIFQVFQAARLAEELVAEADAMDDFAQIRVAGENDADGLGVQPLDVVEQLRPVHAGHPHVGHDDVKGFFLHQREGFGYILFILN